MIKTIYFDLDNTLYDYDTLDHAGLDILQKYCENSFDISADEFYTCFRRAQQLIRRRINHEEAAIHNRLIRYQTMLELLEQPIYPHARVMFDMYWDFFYENMKPMQEVTEFLQGLKEAGFSIGIGTNMTAEVQYKKIECLELFPYIDYLVTSEETGVEKPDLHFFEICLEKAGCLPSECIFVGDHPDKDVAGARECGMHGVLFEKYAKYEKKSHDIPSAAEFTQLSQLILENNFQK
ncbi:MAG: HAD-IA family hydrolase [Lachnospiraceae bacterium]|nr:HAD-IA family hydrolase [Lachnospiraceae bacterium]